MWIVVVGEEHYPSIFHFKTKQEAEICFKKNKNAGAFVHMAEVSITSFVDEYEHTDVQEYKKTFNPEKLDIEWYGTER